MRLRSLAIVFVCALFTAFVPVAQAESISASIAMAGTPVFGSTAACPTSTGCNTAGGYGYYYTSVNFQGSQGKITSPEVDPNNGGVTAANSTVVPYFTTGNPVTFTPSTFPLQPATFSATISSNPTSGGFLLASANGQTAAGIAANATLQYYITSYSITSNYATASGTSGAVTILGNGYFVETATGRTFSNTAAGFRLDVSPGSFTLNALTNGTPLASPSTVTPEPGSLLLLATGLSGIAGAVARRRVM